MAKANINFSNKTGSHAQVGNQQTFWDLSLELLVKKKKKLW